MNDVWVVSRRPEGVEPTEDSDGFENSVYYATYASREVAKEHLELIDGPHDWEDEDSVSVDYDRGVMVFRAQVLTADHLQADREWREKLGT